MKRGMSLDELDDEDYYEILEVGMDASEEDIKASFRRLSMLHHPDRNLGDELEATKRFQKINAAYKVCNYLTIDLHYGIQLCRCCRTQT
jgi:preprotein translocase subunit Sec63